LQTPYFFQTVTAEDVDGDGLSDLAVVVYNDTVVHEDTARLYMNRGGNFSAPNDTIVLRTVALGGLYTGSTQRKSSAELVSVGSRSGFLSGAFNGGAFSSRFSCRFGSRFGSRLSRDFNRRSFRFRRGLAASSDAEGENGRGRSRQTQFELRHRHIPLVPASSSLNAPGSHSQGLTTKASAAST
jgi:hypothetical protein